MNPVRSFSAVAGVAVVASSLIGVPAFADSSPVVNVKANNGTVGVVQPVTGVVQSGPTCWDGQGVSFDFQLGDGSDLGSMDAACTGTSTWTAVMNWTPLAAGSTTLTAIASTPMLGGAPEIGRASTTVTVAAPKSVPSAVGNLRSTGVSANSISLAWDVPANMGNAGTVTYVVSAPGLPTQQTTGTTVTYNNVKAGTYAFTVVARNSVGSSSSVSLNVATQKVATAPDAPRNLKVTGVSTNNVSLNWDAPGSDGGSPITNYKVMWTGPTSGSMSVAATNANVVNLSAGSNYTFTVAAVNALGSSGNVSVVQATAVPAPKPVVQQLLVGPMWVGAPKVKAGQWRTFNNYQNLSTNAGAEASLSAVNRSASVKSVQFRYVGDSVQVRAVLKKGAKSGSFTVREFSPAMSGFTGLSMDRQVKVVK